jgi:hydrogenase expression/formation protein HypC
MCLGVPAEIVSIPDPTTHRAKVAVGGVARMVATDFLADLDLKPGDWVLVHVGFALSRIDAEEAALTLEQIRLIGTAFEDELASFRTSAIR